jgi:hypothetical protein
MVPIENCDQTITIDTCKQSFLTDPNVNLPFADILAKEKPAQSIRILFNNINGIYRSQNWHYFENLNKELKTLSVDIIGLVETNIKWDQRKLKTMRNICQKHYKSTTISAS